MAHILINPGETFEHYHAMDSTTTLLAGRADLHIRGERHPLTLGVVVDVPPGTPHAMTNVGPDIAIIQCGHHGGPGIAL